MDDGEPQPGQDPEKDAPVPAPAKSPQEDAGSPGGTSGTGGTAHEQDD